MTRSSTHFPRHLRHRFTTAIQTRTPLVGISRVRKPALLIVEEGVALEYQSLAIGDTFSFPSQDDVPALVALAVLQKNRETIQSAGDGPTLFAAYER
jgi:hypothetical protein